MSYWKVASFAQPSPIEQILSKDAFTLEELLDEDDIIQECKSLNESLLRFLSEPSTVEALLHYLVDDVPADSLADPKRAYKFPFAACEVLCCELDGVFDALVAEERLLDLLFSPLRRPPPLSPRAAGYLGRVAGALLLRKTGEMMQYLSFRGESLVCRGMVRHVGSAGVADVLRRLAGADDQSAVLFMPVHTQWLAETPLVEALLARMAYAGEAEEDAEVEEEEKDEKRRSGSGSKGEGEGDAAADESGAAVYDEAYCADARANAADILTAIAHTQPSALAAKLSRPECVSLLLRRVLPLAPGEAAPEEAAAGTAAAAEAGEGSADEAAATVASPPAAAEAAAVAPGEAAITAATTAADKRQQEAERRPAAAGAAAAAAKAAAKAAAAAPPQHPDELLPALEVCSALLEPRRSQMVIGGGPDGMGGGDYGLLGGGMLGDEPMMMEGGGGHGEGEGEGGGVGGGGGEGGLGGGGGDAGGPGPDTLSAVLAYVPAIVRFLTDYGAGGKKAAEQQQKEQQKEEGPGGANGGGGAAAPVASSPAKKPPAAAAAAAAAGADSQPAKDSDAEAGDDDDDSSDDGDEADSKGEKKGSGGKEAGGDGETNAEAAEAEADPTYPDPAFSQETTYGLLLPPLGRARLRAVELLAAILRAGGPPAADALAGAGAVRALMALFEAYPFHNLLHHAFGSVVLALLARGGEGAARHLLGDPCRLPEWLARLPREVWPPLRQGQEPAPRPLRAGYLGHVTQVGNILLDAAAASPPAAALLAESAEWSSFVAGELARANAEDDVGAWACGRPSNVEMPGPLDHDAAALMAGMGGMGGGDGGDDGGDAYGGGGGGGLERFGGGSGGGSLYHRYGVLEEEEEEEEAVEGGEGAAEAAAGGAGSGEAAADSGDGDDDANDEASEAARALQGLSVAEADAPEGAPAAAASAASDDDAVLLASDNEGEEGGEGGGGAGGGGVGAGGGAAASATTAAGSPSPPPPAAAAAAATATTA